jgi:DNA-binding NarL/FixJ family response regulator
MLTVYDDPENIFEALTAGAVGYLLKRSGAAE